MSSSRKLLRKELAVSHNSSFGSTPKEERLGRQIDKVKKKLKKVNSELSKLIAPSAYDDKNGNMIMSGDILYHLDDWNHVCVMKYDHRKDDFTLELYDETFGRGFEQLQFVESQAIDSLIISEHIIIGNISDIPRFNTHPRLDTTMIEKTKQLFAEAEEFSPSYTLF